MRRIVTLFIICVLFVFGIRPGFGAVSAQAETPVEAPTLPLVDVNAAGEQLVTLITGLVTTGVNAAWFAPIVALFVGLLKSVPLLYKSDKNDPSGVSAPTLSFAVSTVIWVVAAIVTRLGIDAQFNSLMDLVVQTAPYMFGFLATLGIAPKVHEYAASVKAPILGSKRSPELATATIQAIPGDVLTTLHSVEFDEDALADRIAQSAAKRFGDYLSASGFDWSPSEDKTPAAG